MSAAKKLPDVVFVERELKHLLPQFFLSREQNVKGLEAALAQNNWEEISRIGHTLSGSCGGYGFDALGEFGQELQDLSEKNDKKGINEILNLMRDYIKQVKIEYR